MSKRSTPTAPLVLDTSCAVGTSRAALKALLRRGFRIQISGLALDEFAVHFTKAPVDEAIAKKQRELRGRMRFLSTLLNDPPTLAPVHAALVDKLGGHVVGIPGSFSQWRTSMQSAWVELASGEPLSPDVAAYVERVASYVRDTGEDFLSTFGTIGALGGPTPHERELIEHLLRGDKGILDRISLPARMSVATRFDAYSRVLDNHLRHAHRRIRGRLPDRLPAHTENDAIDTNLLQHLADGLILVTRDYALIELVDATGSRQAPWVRTVGELLVGRAPHGHPFPFNAGRVRPKPHVPRVRAELQRFDLEGEMIAVADSEGP